MRIRDPHDGTRPGSLAGRACRRTFERSGFVFLLTFTTASAAVRADDGPARPPQNPAWTVLEQRTGSGEQCLVCGNRIYDKDIVEVRMQGRTFHVAAGEMFELFDHDPQRYCHKLQAHSVLFDETSIGDRPMSIGWLIIGFYVLVGLICSAICGYLAVSRALDPLPWFFAGLVGNVAAVIVLFLAPKGDPAMMPAGVPAGLAKVPKTRAPVRCPQCGAENHPSASCCGCGATLNATVEPETMHI